MIALRLPLALVGFLYNLIVGVSAVLVIASSEAWGYVRTGRWTWRP